MTLPGVRVEEGRTTEFGEVPLDVATGDVTLEIRNVSGQPLAGASVWFPCPGMPTPIRATGRNRGWTEWDGNYTLTGLPAGEYTFLVALPSHATARVKGVEIVRDERVSRTVVLGKPAGLFVEVRDAEGEPIGRARIGLTDSAGDPVPLEVSQYLSHGSLWTDERGTILLDHLEPGAYRLSVRRGEGTETRIRDVLLVEGETIGVQMTLP